MKRQLGAATLALFSMFPIEAAAAAELGGSMASMRRQHQVAKKNHFTFLRTSAQVREFVEKDRLEAVTSNSYMLVNEVSFPYARPAVKLFIDRLAEQYHAATGERLVVTSLTRPISRQPRNAHRLSVHPTGMAVDLRIPSNAKARQWLESTLISLESRGLLDATRERRPPHYHVAVFPDRYESYVARLTKNESRDVATNAEHSGVASDEDAADEISVVASLEPTDTSHASHEAEHAVDIVESAGADLPGTPLFAALGLTGIAAAGVGIVRRRGRRKSDLN